MIMSFPIFFFTLLPLLFHSSHCTTILVYGLQNGRTPPFTLEIPSFSSTSVTTTSTFSRTRKPLISAISRKPLFSPIPAPTPTRFNDGSLKACQASQKLAIKVTSAVAAATPHASAMPPELAPFSGEVSPSPLFPSHFHPLQAGSPGPSPSAGSPVTAPLVPFKSGSMPFISSNPAVPLPTDEVDSATIRPLPTSCGHEGQVMIGSFGLLVAVLSIALLLL
ncbi:hypothetical protein E2542_SST28068 [Spatholobus suberectus]|nr:hypothetical protein E2542_SST28068 [Spatholobus suberectus]